MDDIIQEFKRSVKSEIMSFTENVSTDKLYPKNPTYVFVPYILKINFFNYRAGVITYPQLRILRDNFNVESSALSYHEKTENLSSQYTVGCQFPNNESVHHFSPSSHDIERKLAYYLCTNDNRNRFNEKIDFVKPKNDFINHVFYTLRHFSILPFVIVNEPITILSRTENYFNGDISYELSYVLDDESYENFLLDQEIHDSPREFYFKGSNIENEKLGNQQNSTSANKNDSDKEGTESNASKTGCNDDMFFTDPVFRDMYKNWRNQTIFKGETGKIEKNSFRESCKTLWAMFLKKILDS